MDHPFNLTTKRILVTGGSSGIGRSVAIHCSEQGAEIHFCGRNVDRLLETKGLLAGQSKHQEYRVDLKDDDAILAFAEELPALQGLVLNAGQVKLAPIKYIKASSIDELFRINLFSSIFLIQALLKTKKLEEGASICFVSSIASQFPTIGNSLYSATKGAVNSFTKSIALELASKKIRVNAILPGFVETSILDSGTLDKTQIAEHEKNYPIGRFGRPQDVAFLVVYLLSDASAWMTGSLIPIDGGFSLK